MHKLVEKQTYRLTLKITLNLHEITQITDIEISRWYPPGSDLPYVEKVPLQPWLSNLLVMASK